MKIIHCGKIEGVVFTLSTSQVFDVLVLSRGLVPSLSALDWSLDLRGQLRLIQDALVLTEVSALWLLYIVCYRDLWRGSPPPAHLTGPQEGLLVSLQEHWLEVYF